MRTALLVTVLTFGALAPAAAQETPVVDISGGYSHLSDEFNGWYATVGGNITSWFALVGDVNWHYRSEAFPASPGFQAGRANFDVRALLGGPRFTFRSGRAAAFVHAKGGVVTSHWDFEGYGGDNSRGAAELGGGVDVWILPRMAIRGGMDGRFVYYEDGDEPFEGEFRFHVGLVVGFGRR